MQTKIPARVAVWGRTSTGREVRVLGRTPADSWHGPGYEIGVRLDPTDGQWRLAWLPESEIVALEARPEIVSN